MSKVFVNILLFLMYVYFFGQHSVQKYFDEGVLIINQEETPTSIQAPGKTILTYIEVFKHILPLHCSLNNFPCKL